jgi:hypothetical protein
LELKTAPFPALPQIRALRRHVVLARVGKQQAGLPHVLALALLDVLAAGHAVALHKLTHPLKAQRLETRKSSFQVQGLKPGGFKLWVNWIQLDSTQPHHALGPHVLVAPVHDDVYGGLELKLDRGVAAHKLTVDPFERANFETRISHFRCKG